MTNEVYNWMTRELQDAPLPIPSDNNKGQMKLYRALMSDLENNLYNDIYE